MRLFIDNKSGIPIYDQICAQIKEQIIKGSLKEDDPLPSIRNLAKDLKISVITTKRAYEELEKEGYIYTIQGKGCFAAGKNPEVIREHYLRQIEAHIAEIRTLADMCGLSEEDVREMVHVMWEETI